MRTLYKFLNSILSTDLIIPLGLIIIYIIFLFILKGVLPTTAEIIAHAEALYSRYGYELIFFGAIFESLVLVNLLAPGSLTIGLGAVFARTGLLDLNLAVMSACLGALIGFSIDYVLGYFGLAGIINKLGYGQILAETKSRIEKDKIKTFGLGFIHPNVGTVISLAAGSAKANFLQFLLLATISTVFWISLWGVIIYILGEVFLKVLSKYFPLIMLLLLSFWVLSILYTKTRRSDKSDKIG